MTPSMKTNNTSIAPYARYHNLSTVHPYNYLWISFHLHMEVVTKANLANIFSVLLQTVFEHAQAVSDTPAKNTSITSPLLPQSPTNLICEAWSVSPTNRPYTSPSPLVADTSDDCHYNLEDTLTAKQVMMMVSFSSV